MAALGKADEVRVTLSGPAIHPVTAFCLSPGSRVPSPARYDSAGRADGKAHPYHLTVQEEPGTRFVVPPAMLRKTANPETIYSGNRSGPSLTTWRPV